MARFLVIHVLRFRFEEQPKRARQGRRSRLREDALQSGAGKSRRSRLTGLTRSAAADVSRLTGRRAGTPQASELQADTRRQPVVPPQLHRSRELDTPLPTPFFDGSRLPRC
jgi:hypothetical protein